MELMPCAQATTIIGPVPENDKRCSAMWYSAMVVCVWHPETESLLKAEMFFVRMRRLRQLEREKEPLDTMIVNWSRVAERFLSRVLVGLGSGGEGKPLGQLIGMAKKALERGSGSRNLEEENRLRSVLNELDQLDILNKKGGKHLGGIDLNWEHVVSVYP
ncbi:hypothetical protein H8A97_36455, partial [Bradyrhizobium sp. Arg62]|uniref:hypothetical protein n=1 Tax=Bradyrhizobium brasilense TaxID=1419277 RepID=UPI001E5B6B5A